MNRTPSIVMAVKAHANLIKTSTGFKCLCPLHGHKEKTPSFFLNHKTNTFYCFSCNLGGDTYRFLEIIYGLSYDVVQGKIKIGEI